MRKLFLNKIILFLLLLFLVESCTEQYVLQTNTFEEALVVEARLTNELKKQELKISKTYRFEDNGPLFESGATVFVSDNMGNHYPFEEQDGIYVSTIEFKAEPEKTYRLNIKTKEGKSYISTTETLTTSNNIESLEPSVIFKDGERGVQINVNSYDPSATSKYYKYEYEETYKIIAPKWVLNKAVVTGPKEVSLFPRTTEAKTCYSTKTNADVIITTTAGLNEDRINFPVRFISNQNYIISHRYSILVRQYVESLAAYTFYKTLKQLSATGSILSQNQPGFFYGNIKSVENPDEKIIGFFEVSSVSSKRIFFNYADLFPNEALPPYYTKCDELVLNFCFISPGCSGDQIIEGLNDNTLVHFYRDGNVYHMYTAPCGDCTTFSSNIIPSFWTN